MQSRLWEDVNEGDQLPELTFGPLTLKRFLMMIAGTRDFNPQHHNYEWNRKAGSKNNYVTHPWHEAMFGRYVTDWTGPDADFRGLSLAMMVQVFQGETITVTGNVAKKYQDGDDYLLHIELLTSTPTGPAARGSATMAMPSKAGGGVKPRLAPVRPDIPTNPDLPDFAKDHIGKVSPMSTESPYAISEAQIAYWNDMVEDANPLYSDTDYAKDSRHKGMIAPPMSVMVWCFERPGDGNDVDDPNRVKWPQLNPPAASGMAQMQIPNTGFGLATNSVLSFGKPLRVGDKLRSTSELVNVSNQKRTHLGTGYFTTSLLTYYNQDDEAICTKVQTAYIYDTVNPKT